MISYIITILLGYILGCSHMSFYLSKIKKVNIKENGSKNYGASNALMLMGKKAGILVFLHDFLKSFFAYKIAELIFPQIAYIGLIAGLASIIGHIFPFYLKFNGGKGFASYIGLIFAINIKAGIITILMILIISFLTDYIVMGTFSTILISPLLIAFLLNDFKILIFMYIVSLIIFLKHKENIKNIINKKEPKLKKILFKK